MTRTHLEWTDHWNGFMLFVTCGVDGYRAAVKPPWETIEMRISASPDLTLKDAKARCFGMVKQALELKAADAAEAMESVK